MNVKLGFGIWKVNYPPVFYKRKTMIIGADVHHNVGGKVKKRSVIGFCATMDDEFTKFYSRVDI